MREPLIIPLAAVGAGICLSQIAPFSSREASLAFLSLSLVSIAAWLFCRPSVARAAGVFALIALGALAAALHRPGPAPELDAASGEVVILSGCVVQPTVFSQDREQFLLEIEPGAVVRVSLSLKPEQQAPRLNYGQRAELEAKVRKPRNFGNPGAFDYVRYLSRQNIFWTASASASTPVTVLPGRCGSRVAAGIFALRQAALNRIESLYRGDEYAIAMMEAILIGESSKLEKVWTEDFRRTGTFHALVISGIHVTVLAGVLLFLLRLATVNEILALAIAAAGAWLYAAVSGWSAPVIRAAGGFSLYLIARYFSRRGRLLNLLAAVGLGYLLYDPDQLFDASFQLSFFSVAAIGAFAVPMLEATTKIWRAAALNLSDRDRDLRLEPRAASLRVEFRLLAETVTAWVRIPIRVVQRILEFVVVGWAWSFEVMLVSAIIQVALALPMVIYFHRISITGLSANLVIGPLLSAVVPVGFAAIFTGSRILSSLALVMLKISEAVAAWHVRFEPAHRVPDPPLWLAALLCGALLLAAVALRLKRGRLPALAACIGLFAVLLICPFPPLIEPGKLELTAIDVGQGDSLFVALPDGRTMIVDAGGILAYGRRVKPRMDIGEDVVSPYLWTRRLQRVDVIAVSHAHEDHIGGLIALLENFHPRELWTGAMPENPGWLAVERHARDLGIPVVRRRAGERDSYIEILAPLAGYTATNTARNNDSLVMRITSGRHSFLLMADLEKQVEYQLVAANVIGPATVLKVGHHGSRTSSTELFIETARPVFAVISAGFENSFRHPHPEVVERLERHRATILRTDLEGLVTIRTDGHRLEVEKPVQRPSRISSDPSVPRSY